MEAISVDMDWQQVAASNPAAHEIKAGNRIPLDDVLKEMLEFANEIFPIQLKTTDMIPMEGYHQEAFDIICDAFLLGAMRVKSADFVGSSTPHELAYFSLVRYLQQKGGKTLPQIEHYVSALCHAPKNSKTAQFIEMGYHYWNNPGVLREYLRQYPPQQQDRQQWINRRALWQQVIFLSLCILTMLSIMGIFYILT